MSSPSLVCGRLVARVWTSHRLDCIAQAAWALLPRSGQSGVPLRGGAAHTATRQQHTPHTPPHPPPRAAVHLRLDPSRSAFIGCIPRTICKGEGPRCALPPRIPAVLATVPSDPAPLAPTLLPPPTTSHPTTFPTPAAAAQDPSAPLSLAASECGCGAFCVRWRPALGLAAACRQPRPINRSLRPWSTSRPSSLRSASSCPAPCASPRATAVGFGIASGRVVGAMRCDIAHHCLTDGDLASNTAQATRMTTPWPMAM